MNKKEFLDGLYEQLHGQMDEGKIQSHLRYYQEYIETQMKNGTAEAEVVGMLGAPQLIAKTLLDTETDSYGDYTDSAASAQYDTNEYDATYGDDFSSTHRQDNGEYEKNPYAYGADGFTKHRSWHIDLNTWYGKLLVIAVAVLIIAGLLFIIGTIIPVLIIVFLILTVFSYFKSRWHK